MDADTTSGTKPQLDDLWQAFYSHGDLNSKSGLVEAYLPLVKRAVSRVRPFLPDFIQEEDLIGDRKSTRLNSSHT